jgi:hypothetical protein
MQHSNWFKLLSKFNLNNFVFSTKSMLSPTHLMKHWKIHIVCDMIRRKRVLQFTNFEVAWNCRCIVCRVKCQHVNCETVNISWYTMQGANKKTHQLKYSKLPCTRFGLPSHMCRSCEPKCRGETLNSKLLMTSVPHKCISSFLSTQFLQIATHWRTWSKRNRRHLCSTSSCCDF